MAIYEVPAYYTLSPMFTQCPPFMTCPPYTYLAKGDLLKVQRELVVRYADMLEVQIQAARQVIEAIEKELGKM